MANLTELAGGVAVGDPTLVLLSVTLVVLIIVNTFLRRKMDISYSWMYAFVKIVAYTAMFVLSVVTSGPIVAVSVISTYVGMELQRLLMYARELGIVIIDFFTGNANGSRKQAE